MVDKEQWTIAENMPISNVLFCIRVALSNIYDFTKCNFGTCQIFCSE